MGLSDSRARWKITSTWEPRQARRAKSVLAACRKRARVRIHYECVRQQPVRQTRPARFPLPPGFL